MIKKLTPQDYTILALEFGLSVADVKTVATVESSGKGVDPVTGKIIIQFEPAWFKKLAVKEYVEYCRIQNEIHEALSAGGSAKLTPIERTFFNNMGIILNNGVKNQDAEWMVFNLAFAINPNAAMQSTSIGLMQVMGFHFFQLGFATVGSMWNFAKESEANQLRLGLRFIRSNTKMFTALKTHDWPTFAYYYNGAQYKKFNYDTRLATAFKSFIN